MELLGLKQRAWWSPPTAYKELQLRGEDKCLLHISEENLHLNSLKYSLSLPFTFLYPTYLMSIVQPI